MLSNRPAVISAIAVSSFSDQISPAQALGMLSNNREVAAAFERGADDLQVPKWPYFGDADTYSTVASAVSPLEVSWHA